MAATAATGLYAAEGVMIAPSACEYIIDYHKRYMIAVLALNALLSAWTLIAHRFPRRGRLVFIALLVLMTTPMVKGADDGGWMTYGYNARGQPPQPIEFGQ